MKQAKRYSSNLYRTATILLLSSLSAAISVMSVQAGSATWAASPISSDWNTAANWDPNTVPGDGDTATFATSSEDQVTISTTTDVDKITFAEGADAFTISVTVGLPAVVFNINSGITNNSAKLQNFFLDVDSDGNGSGLGFVKHANAGDLCTFTIAGNSVPTNLGSNIEFLENSGAGTCTYINKPGLADGCLGGSTTFFSDAQANAGTFINEGATVSGAQGGVTTFLNNTLAGTSTLIANGGSNGGDGGLIQFEGSSRGETARVELFGNGTMDLSLHNSNSFSVGSIEGDGVIIVGLSGLKAGTNNLSSTFSGLIEDDGFTSATFTKTGTGTLTLSGANTYSGGTTVNGGVLVAANKSGSATGTGVVTVKTGTLGGKGIIAGVTTIGTGSGTGAFLAPAVGTSKQATLTIQSALTFNSDATYTCTFQAKKNRARTDLVVANGVTITGASLNLSGQTQGNLKPGLTLTLISNTSATPISGTFSNLPDGGTVTINGNNFQASYEGGDGNDLTLTVVP